MDDVSLVHSHECYIESFNRAVDAVARERRYIAFVEGPTLSQTAAFVRHVLDGNGVQQLAVATGNVVVGWCDIVWNQQEGFRHVGRLGMALLSQYRGRGLGRRLAHVTLQAARESGIERVELDVFTSNTPAISLYKSLGFVEEGIKRHARKLDGRYDDNLFMALLFDSTNSDTPEDRPIQR